jgi:alkylated DNA nucleotide flippase Atl1
MNDRRKPLEWAHDGQRYRPTQIVSQILQEALGSEATTRGPAWWVNADGDDLPTLAGAPGRSAFDWTELHDLLAAIPEGRWTTYGDLAAVVGTAAQPVGQHVTRCIDCPYAWRVLGGDGRPRQGFRWTDGGRTDTQQEALAQEGVRFTGGAAARDQRILGSELNKLRSVAR